MAAGNAPGGAGLGIAAALGAAVGYGLNIVCARIAAVAGLTGPPIIFYRVLIMLAAVLAIVAWRGRLPAVPRAERAMLAVVVAGSAVMGVCYISSVTFIPVTLAVVVFYTYPVLIVLMNPLVQGGGLSLAQLATALAAFLGLVLVVGPVTGAVDPRGLALAGIASVVAAMQFFAAARCRGTPLVATLFWVHLGVLPVAALVAWATGQFLPPQALALAPIAVTVTIAGYLVSIALQFVALARIGAVLTGLLLCLEPVVATALSVSLLGERLGPLQYAGGALVLGAVAATVLDGRRAERVRAAPVRPAPAGDRR